uniref:C-type lectin domain-containing protein n=1 Tax=Poecilia mexicana TaxID=48701 RepID=A0A3B3WLK8_9TELE
YFFFHSLMPPAMTLQPPRGCAPHFGNHCPIVFHKLFSWQKWDSSWFEYLKEKYSNYFSLDMCNKTWTEAQQYCREKHTDLVTVTNMKDMERLITILAGEMKEAWIGLYDPTNGTRTWRWSLPGVEFNESETNWKTGEPTDGESENCAYLENLKWIDTGCRGNKYFVCFNREY